MNNTSDYMINFFEKCYINSFVVQSKFNEIKNDYNMVRDSFNCGLSKCKSPIEKIMYCILETTELCTVIPQYKIDDRYIADFLVKIPSIKNKIIFECDGHDFNEKTKEQAQHDKERDRRLNMLGYDVYRFTGSEIYRNPFKVMIEVVTILNKYINGDEYE